MSIRKLFVLLLFINVCISWDLTHLGIYKYHINHMSVYRNRAFLSIEILEDDNNKNSGLIEVTWPQKSIIQIPPRFFNLLIFRPQECDYLFNVISTSIDRSGRIWILDEGNDTCPGKLLIATLHTNVVIYIFEFQDKLHKPACLTLTPSLQSQKAFVGLHNVKGLYICKLDTKTCHFFHLIEDQKHFYKNDIASTEELVISENELVLFITSSNSLGLHGVDLEFYETEQEGKVDYLMAIHLGDKLGFSSGLTTYSNRYLCYYLLRDYAIVCWDVGQQLIAEGHQVIMQSYEDLAIVQQLFEDTQHNLWAVINPEKYYDINDQYMYQKINDLQVPKCIRII